MYLFFKKITFLFKIIVFHNAVIDVFDIRFIQ